MKKTITILMTLALLTESAAVLAWAAPVPVQPTTVTITVDRKRFDNPDLKAIVRYLLIDVSQVDLRPIDEAGNEGDGIPDIQPKGVLMLFVGGNGVLNLTPTSRNTESTNFLARTRYHFAAEGFIVALVDAASDFLAHNHPTVTDPITGFCHESGLRGHRLPNRLYGDKYALDLQAVIDDLRVKFPSLPLWAVGTSMGTISAALTATLSGPPDGIVLTSPLTGPNCFGDLSSENIDLGLVKLPTLITTHQDDRPEDAKRLKKRFTSSPRVQLLIFEGGSTALTDLTAPLSPHGYFGIEQKVIDAIARWIEHVER